MIPALGIFAFRKGKVTGKNTSSPAARSGRTFSLSIVFGYLPVMPLVLGSAFVMVVVSLLTKAPGRATLEKYFSNGHAAVPLKAVEP